MQRKWTIFWLVNIQLVGTSFSFVLYFFLSFKLLSACKQVEISQITLLSFSIIWPYSYFDSKFKNCNDCCTPLSLTHSSASSQCEGIVLRNVTDTVLCMREMISRYNSMKLKTGIDWVKSIWLFGCAGIFKLCYFVVGLVHSYVAFHSTLHAYMSAFVSICCPLLPYYFSFLNTFSCLFALCVFGKARNLSYLRLVASICML